MVRIFMLIGLCLALLNCQEALVLKRTSFISSNLKINGYFYGNQNGVNNIHFLYLDGTIRYVGSLKTNDVNEIDKYILREFINSKPFDKSRVSWGLYIIESNKIAFDMWYPRADAPVYRRNGIILNDSTFVIKSVSKPNGKEFKEENTTYHFRQFSPKPDSTNNFIK